MKLYRLYGHNPLLGEMEPITPPASYYLVYKIYKKYRDRRGVYTKYKIKKYTHDFNFMEL